jgi:hypothetical protein
MKFTFLGPTRFLLQIKASLELQCLQVPNFF